MSATQVHRTTGTGYSVAVWHVDNYWVIQATEGAFIPSKLLRPSAVTATYEQAMRFRDDWVNEYRSVARV